MLTLNKCRICGNRNVTFIRNGNEVKVVCPICGEEGKSVRIGDSGNKYRVADYNHKTSEIDTAKEVAAMNWNNE